MAKWWNGLMRHLVILRQQMRQQQVARLREDSYHVRIQDRVSETGVECHFMPHHIRRSLFVYCGFAAMMAMMEQWSTTDD